MTLGIPDNDGMDSKERFLGIFESPSPRTRNFLGGIVSVVVLAGVILGVSALSAPKSTKPLDTQLSTTTAAPTGEDLYNQGLAATESGETTKAIALLEQSLAADPENAQARQVLDTLRSRSSSKNGSSENTDVGDSPGTDNKTGSKDPSGGKNNGNTGGDNSVFDKTTGDLTVLLPAGVSGFSLGQSVVMGDDATVSGTPDSPDTLSSNAVWTVHYRGSKEQAKKFVDEVSKGLYSKDPLSVEVDGVTGFFGTDGSRFATVVYTRGRYVFEVTLATVEGQPSRLRAEAVKGAQAFADTL